MIEAKFSLISEMYDFGTRNTTRDSEDRNDVDE